MENDHDSQARPWTRCRSLSQRRRAGADRCFAKPFGFPGGGWGGGWGFHHHHIGLGLGFVGAVAAAESCYVTRLVDTPYGLRYRTINVCAY